MNVLTYIEETGSSIHEAPYVFNTPFYSTAANGLRSFKEHSRDGLI